MFVGSAAVEMKINDSLSGERLIAAVDKRRGERTYKATLTNWGDVEKVCNHWADLVQQRLQEYREQKQASGKQATE